MSRGRAHDTRGHVASVSPSHRAFPVQRWGPPAGTPRPSPWLPGRAHPRARRARLCNTCARAFATCACARTFARLCVCTRGLGRTLPRPSRGRPLWEGKLRQGWGRGWQPPLMTPAGPAVSSVCSSAPGSGPSSPNSSHSAIAENGFTGSVPNIHAEVGAAGEGGTRVCGERAVSVLGGGGACVCLDACHERARGAHACPGVRGQGVCSACVRVGRRVLRACSGCTRVPRCVQPRYLAFARMLRRVL